MTRRELEESRSVIERMTDNYEKRIGGPTSKEEAIRFIREGRPKYLFKPGLSWKRHEKRLRESAISLSYTIVKLICEDPDDNPIRILVSFYYEMDDVISREDDPGPIVLNYANYMKNSALILLDIIEGGKKQVSHH